MQVLFHSFPVIKIYYLYKNLTQIKSAVAMYPLYFILCKES